MNTPGNTQPGGPFLSTSGLLALGLLKGPPAAPAPPEDFLPTLIPSDEETVGVWRVDSWQTGTPKASVSLRDLKSKVKATLPLRVFTREDYPGADQDTIGERIPAAFGVVLGCKAFLIDASTKRFKVFDHSVESFQAFYTEDGDQFTPDTIDLGTGEFTWSLWADEALFADATLTGENPVDCVKLLLTDTERGASLPLTDLDTTSTGVGFGSAGARVHYVYGTVPTQADAESTTFAIGLYMDESKDVFEWIQQVLVASYSILYVDRAGVYQIKAWRPVVGEDVLEIEENHVIPGSVRPKAVATTPTTRATAKYARNHGLGFTQVVEHADDELRQLRGLTEHAALEKVLPLSDRFGAVYWAERAVAMRGVPRRTVSLQVTQEHTLLEPGEYARLTYSALDIDEIFEVLAVTIRPGASVVNLHLIDVRGFKDGAGFWTEDAGAFAFPAELGGATITAWDPTWTDAEKKWYRENKGVWTDGDGYADATLDPLWSFRGSRWT